MGILFCNSTEERNVWIKCINDAMTNNQNIDGPKIDNQNSKILQKSASNILNVCWHRQVSISYSEYNLAFRNEMSGILFRQFKKKSMGWQRLWVVYSMFTLYFFKRAHEQTCIASLPILGYKVDPTNESDNVDKNFVFKICLNNHLYYF